MKLPLACRSPVAFAAALLSLATPMRAQTPAILRTLNGVPSDGETPLTNLVQAPGGTLANPRLARHTTVNSADITVAANAGWGGGAALGAAFEQAGAFRPPATSADAALLPTLVPGAATAQITGANDTTGVALVEIHEMPWQAPRLRPRHCRTFSFS